MPLARYTYLPWLRRGAANAITVAATTSSRASVAVSLAVNDGAAVGAPINKSFRLMGPGDVIGMAQDLVVRCEPRAGVTDFEPNYLAFIDFYDEDFAWRHTPAPAAAHRLNPWLTLLVLAEGEFEMNRLPGRPLASVRVTIADVASVFPPEDQLWAWAHVQLLGEVGGADAPDLGGLRTRLEQSPDSGVARLISPRRLHPNTGYAAFVIPTFEVGRKAGLGLAINDAADPGVAIAWAGGASEFPVYFEWRFRTGEEGDFEDLVERMVPRPVDPRVGVRDIDIASPGFGMPVVPQPVGPAHHIGVVGLEGALKAPTMQPKPLDPGSRFPQDAAPVVNAPSVAQAAGEGDPVVAPPLYAGWHVLVDRVDPSAMGTWVNQLSLDPRERCAAGLGARVIRTKQEDYMKLAWQQVGEVLAANRRATFFRFAMKAAEKSFVKSVAALPQERFLAVTAPVFSRVLGSPKTIRGLLSSSRLPVAALSPAFRKLMRPRGLVVRRALPPQMRAAAAGTLAGAINDGKASASPPAPPVAGPTVGGIADAVGATLTSAAWWLRWGWLVLLALLALALLAVVVVGGAVGIAVALAVAACGVLVVRAIERARNERRAADNLHLEKLVPAAVAASPPVGFALSAPGVSSATPMPAAAAAEFAQAVTGFAAFIAAKAPVRPAAPRFGMGNAAAKVAAAIAPTMAFPKRVANVIRIGDRSIVDYARDAYPTPPVNNEAGRIVPVMAYPDLKDAMYRPLSELSNDLFVPNLGLVPPNTISLMLTNPPFIEAYMAGLNHEFARELLWREYPTDCRGTPFRQFWEVGSIPTPPGMSAAQRAEKLKDIPPIHKWATNSALGDHGQRNASAGKSHVVLVIRGDLLKRYPNTVIYAQDAVWSKDPKHVNELALIDEDGTKVLAQVETAGIHHPLFVAPVAADLTFVGFDATSEQVRGDPALEEDERSRLTIPADRLGWFFVLQEIVGETRFGLDERDPKPGTESGVRWDNLSWEAVQLPANKKVINLATPFATTPSGDPGLLKWHPAEGATAADVAAILRQKPVLVGVHGRQMLERGKVD